MTEKEILQPKVSSVTHVPGARERTPYLAAFGVLVALTLVEIGVVRSGGIAHRAEGHVRLAGEPVEHDLGENHQRGRE